jgi:hypothetical protein
MCIALPAGAQTARPGDRAVEDLIEQVLKAEEQFVRALDKNIKKSTVRGASGETDVENFLDDFKTSLDRLEERFDSKYAASAELNAVLRQAGDIERFIQSQSPSLKGRSEWDDFKASLQTLAAAYGSVFPPDPNKPPRRMNDYEIQQAADSAIDHGSDLKRELSDVFTKEEEKDAKETAQDDIEAMQSAAKKLKSRVDDGKPASGEAGVFVASVKKLHSTLGSRTLSEDAKTANDGISKALAKVEQAFGMSTASEAATAATTGTGAAAPAAVPTDTAPAATDAPAAPPAAEPAAPPATTAPATTTPPADSPPGT